MTVNTRSNTQGSETPGTNLTNVSPPANNTRSEQASTDYDYYDDVEKPLLSGCLKLLRAATADSNTREPVQLSNIIRTLRNLLGSLLGDQGGE